MTPFPQDIPAGVYPASSGTGLFLSTSSREGVMHIWCISGYTLNLQSFKIRASFCSHCSIYPLFLCDSQAFLCSHFSPSFSVLSGRLAAGKVQAQKHNTASQSSNKSAAPPLPQPDKSSIFHWDLHIHWEFGSKTALEFTGNHFEFPGALPGLPGAAGVPGLDAGDFWWLKGCCLHM